MRWKSSRISARACFRRLAFKVAQLVDTAALDRGPGPHEPDGASQPGIAVDDGQQRRPQPARDEIVEAALPGHERFASAQLQGEQVLSPIGEDADYTKHADHLSGTAHAKSEA